MKTCQTLSSSWWVIERSKLKNCSQKKKKKVFLLFSRLCPPLFRFRSARRLAPWRLSTTSLLWSAFPRLDQVQCSPTMLTMRVCVCVCVCVCVYYGKRKKKCKKYRGKSVCVEISSTLSTISIRQNFARHHGQDCKSAVLHNTRYDWRPWDFEGGRGRICSPVQALSGRGKKEKKEEEEEEKKKKEEEEEEEEEEERKKERKKEINKEKISYYCYRVLACDDANLALRNEWSKEERKRKRQSQFSFQ